MILRLVEQQQVGPKIAHERAHESGLLASANGPDGLEHPIAAESEPAQERAELLLRRACGSLAAEPLQVPERRVVRAQLLELMLGEVADAQIARFSPFAFARFELAREQFHQRRLTRSVATEQRDAIPRLNRHADRAQHDAVAISDGLLLEREKRPRQLLRRQERELERRVDMRGRDALHPFERLHATLRLACLARLRAEALDEAHHVLDLALLALVHRLLLRELRRALLFERRVIARVDLRLTVLEVHDAAHGTIEELAIVRNHEQRALIVAQPALEPDDGVEIEVVR